LTRIFGAENLDLAEDVVQDSLVEALNQWTYKGIPDNPSGWLFTVAKNKALNIINPREEPEKVFVRRGAFSGF
jgi:predicted RNA polymerase sigma factor